MNELSLSTFERAIQSTHGAHGRLVERARVSETFEGERVWEGEVLVFELLDHPTAQTCYAWSVDNQIVAVLHEGPIDSPRAAVQAALIEQYKRLD